MSGTAKARYEKLATYRTQALERGRECARLTIPQLCPPEGANEATKYPTPYQAMGSRGTNHMASRLMLALFPPNQPIFRLTIGDFALEQMAKQPGMRGEVEKALGSIEREVTTDFEASMFRGPMFEALKQIIVVGNVTLRELPDGTYRLYPLANFVWRRSPSGKVVEIVLLDVLSPAELTQAQLATLTQGPSTGASDDPERTINAYTHCKFSQGKWTMEQFLEASTIPLDSVEYPEDEFPVYPISAYLPTGEHYSRSYVGEVLGDLWSLESLKQSLVQASAAAARLIWGVRPGAACTPDDLQSTPNGGYVLMNEGDVFAVKVDKEADLAVTKATHDSLWESLAASFLLTSSVLRDAERVTAEEVRAVINEIEQGHGGLYASLGTSLQLPMVRARIARMTKQGRLPTLPKGVVRPQIVTGLDALGRGNDVNRLERLAQSLSAAFGPEAAADSLHPSEYASRVSAGLGVDSKGLVKTREEKAQELAEQRQQEIAAAAAGPVATAMTQPAPDQPM